MSDDGRSPNRPRQLHDLRLLPTATDPRPTFFWSAESPRDLLPTVTEFKQLLWHGETNVEITVHSREELAQKQAEGYQLLPVAPVVLDQVDTLSEALDRLSPEERAIILAQQADVRRRTLVERLANLSDADIDKILHGASPAKAARKRA